MCVLGESVVVFGLNMGWVGGAFLSAEIEDIWSAWTDLHTVWTF